MASQAAEASSSAMASAASAVDERTQRSNGLLEPAGIYESNGQRIACAPVVGLEFDQLSETSRGFSRPFQL
jgi:hypothetical protein